jgi:hypothetical protein
MVPPWLVLSSLTVNASEPLNLSPLDEEPFKGGREEAFHCDNGIFFALGAVGHLLRFFVFHWEIRVGEVMVSVWGSLPGTLVAGLFSFMLWKEAHR